MTTENILYKLNPYVKEVAMDGCSELVCIEMIQGRIAVIRGKKVMIDRDLANLYDVETK